MKEMISATQKVKTSAEVNKVMMRRICAWCNKDLDPCIPSGNQLTTHGICVPCANKVILKEKMRLQDLVDRLELMQE